MCYASSAIQLATLTVTTYINILEKSQGKIRDKIGEIWQIFMAITSDPACRNIICVFDALDEC